MQPQINYRRLKKQAFGKNKIKIQKAFKFTDLPMGRSLQTPAVQPSNPLNCCCACVNPIFPKISQLWAESKHITFVEFNKSYWKKLSGLNYILS